MEIGELVWVVLGDAASDDCPFEHRPREQPGAMCFSTGRMLWAEVRGMPWLLLE